MHFGTGSPITSFIPLAVVAFMSLISGKRKKSLHNTITKEFPKPISIPNHPGKRSVVYEVCNVDCIFASETLKLPEGSELKLKLIENLVYIVVNNRNLWISSVQLNSPLIDVLENCRTYHAYLYKRDNRAAGIYDFFSIIVYY